MICCLFRADIKHTKPVISFEMWNQIGCGKKPEIKSWRFFGGKAYSYSSDTSNN
jgi:hypothetical protein